MNQMDAPRPDFNEPPVVEVALSVQFDSLGKLRTPQLGLLWQEFRKRFPVTEEHAPLAPVVERFGAQGRRKGLVRIELQESPPKPRCWFLTEAGTELIQVQHDRFVHNWRKAGTDAEYPRYEHIRATFANELTRFADFIAREQLGTFTATQCEVTYVNHITAGKGWQEHGDLGNVLTVFRRSFSDDFLESVEDAAVRLRFVMRNEAGEPIGRLHAVLDPGYRTGSDRPLFTLNLTARGAPLGEEIDGVLKFLDLGREWVVRGFASLTTPAMHKEWGRKDGAKHC
jgi:uncharacterized protein (TIGR04255 family)